MGQSFSLRHVREVTRDFHPLRTAHEHRARAETSFLGRGFAVGRQADPQEYARRTSRSVECFVDDKNSGVISLNTDGLVVPVPTLRTSTLDRHSSNGWSLENRDNLLGDQ